MRNQSPFSGRRRGITATLAMLYLILFSTLAVGFYAAFSLAQQSSYSEREARRALAAAESGMEFMRQRLYELNIAYSSSTANLMDKVEAGLRAQLDGTQNLSGGSIARSGQKLLIPGDATQFVKLDNTGMGFRAEISLEAAQLVVTVTGRSSDSVAAADVLRSVQLRYAMLERPSSIFNFGVASRSPITLKSNARITGSLNPAHGSILSTSTSSTPVQVLGNSQVSGSVSITNATGNVVVESNASIAGSTSAAVKSQYIHKGIAEPEFPAIDTDIFKPFATNVISTPGVKYTGGVMKNLYIKANVNPTFDSNMEVQGVVYIETPNKVTFSSNVQVTGVIAVQNNPTGTLSQNVLSFDSNVTLNGVEKLPATADFPPELRALKGSVILAPGFDLVMNSNFGSAGGSIVADRIHFDSNAVGTVSGSVINLKDTSVSFDSNAAIIIANQGTAFAPAGMHFGSRYVPLPASYKEILP